MASYKKTKTGWSVRVSRRENGKLKQVYKAGFATKNEAKAFAQEIESAESIGNKREKTFADYFTEWHETYKSGKVAPSTYRKYLHVDKILHDHFPDTTLSDMTRQKYQAFLNDYGANHSKEMMSEVNVYVRSCVKSALYDEIIKKDFTIGIELPYDRSKTWSVEYLSLDEVKTLRFQPFFHDLVWSLTVDIDPAKPFFQDSDKIILRLAIRIVGSFETNHSTGQQQFFAASGVFDMHGMCNAVDANVCNKAIRAVEKPPFGNSMIFHRASLLRKCDGRIFFFVIKQSIVFFFQCFDHVIGKFVVRRRNAKLFAHAHQCAGEHVNLRVATGIEIL